MKGSYGKYGMLGVLILVLLVGLLVASGTAVAGGIIGPDPPGPAWKGMDISGRAFYVSGEGPFLFRMTGTDPRLNGTMYVYVTDGGAEADYTWAEGTYDLYNDAGVLTWHSDYWYSVYGKGDLTGRQAQGRGWNISEGRGPYAGLDCYSENISGAGFACPIVWKAVIY